MITNFSDSLYMAISGATLDDIVKPHLKDEWNIVKEQWFPRVDTAEHRAYDVRTPGMSVGCT